MPTVLVVGADRGIAHALSRQLNERGDSVIAA
jgi:NAD(P)-dependent dehydrogenase (short-subunit alcohol dehydrogenase family)